MTDNNMHKKILQQKPKRCLHQGIHYNILISMWCRNVLNCLYEHEEKNMRLNLCICMYIYIHTSLHRGTCVLKTLIFYITIPSRKCLRVHNGVDFVKVLLHLRVCVRACGKFVTHLRINKILERTCATPNISHTNYSEYGLQGFDAV
jgi:hypothetical protein